MGEALAIETRDLTKAYDEVTVVDRLNMQVRENEIFGLLGPNGAGKTTTILMLLGLTEPVSGTARVYGFNPTREPLKVKRVVGYLPEKVGFYESLNAVENLGFIAELNNIGKVEADSRIIDVLKAVDLTGVRDLAVGKYSRGMKQRLGIAQVLIKKPKLVFLDEPTSGLDPRGINQLLDLITSLPKMGTTVVLSSHQLYQVQKVCHSVGILAKGKMVIQGSLDKLGRDALTGGRYAIEVETTESAAPLVAVLQKVKGVATVTAAENVLRLTADADLRPEIARAVVQNNFSLVQMKVQEFSLDDIYMKYFQQENA
ncbi:MAG: ABC transporter ATP-binding protein [Chloroflexi bacterium]|nr:ABC transporter ATP-binding protein [Chloroflexota bacterium]